MRTFYKKRLLLINITTFFCFIFFANKLNAQVSIPNTSPVTETFTGFAGAASPANWTVQGTGTRGTTWNGINQGTGSSGGWYGNNNMSFLGSNQATNGNATWLLQNNTGYTITGFTLSFTARLWKTGTSSPAVTLSYTSNASPATPAQGALANSLSSLTFNDATTNIATGAVITQTITTANIAPGDYIFIRFIHAGGTNSDNLGWDDVQFTAITSQVNISAISPSSGNIYPNTTNNILQSFTATPVFTGLTLSNLTVNTGGTYTTSDLTSAPFKLYANTSNSLSGATQIGSAQTAVASGGTVTFSGLSQNIAVGVTEYFIVTVDLSSTAILGNTINLSSTGFSNIVFSATIVKNGTDPLAASNAQTIAAAVSVSNAGTPAAANIGQSSTDNTIFGFQVSPAGASSLTDFTSVTINASGSVVNTDMYNFKIVKDVDASGDYSGGDIVVSGSVPFSSSMTFAISGETGITSATNYLVLGDVTTTPNYGATITLSINSNLNISLSNTILSTAPYTGNTQTIVNTGTTSLATDYFRSVKVNGNWTTTSTWESSTDNATWHTATLYPLQTTSHPVLIQNGTTVTIDSTIKAKRIVVQSGGTLVHTNGKTFTLVDVATAGITELIIDGTYVLKGTMPIINSGAAVVVDNGGVVRVDDNTGGESDDFARLTTVLFKTGAVYQWNKAAQAFEAGGSASGAVTYFPSSTATDKPIFRITANPGDIGGSNSVTFNGKVEVTTGNATNIRFVSLGTKYFRDGLGSPSGYSGKITNTTGCGAFIITGSSAVIDGNLIFNVDDATSVTNDLEIASGASVTISGAPTIKIGSNAPGSNMVINGTLLHNGTVPIEIYSGNLYINGYINPSSTGSFQAGSSSTSTTLVSLGGTSNTTAGSLRFSSGANYVNTFTMNRGTSGTGGSLTMASSVNTKSFVFTRGVLATDNNLVTWLNTGSGSTMTQPASYSDSYICTCNSSGIEITPTGSNGFRINNVSGSTDQMFPVGTNFNAANRMAINMNSSTADNFTVVVGTGDIGSTPKPKVNRIWYVSEGTTGGSTATMKLYFTKRDWNTYPYGSAQNDEIETGFNYADPHLVQKNYSNLFVNVATTGTPDIPDYTASSYLSEIFGRYYLGISTDYYGTVNGITGFTKFSVVNAEDIILPVSFINGKAYQKGNGIAIDWSALNELNISSYEIERSADAFHFTKILSISSLHSGNPINNYSVTDINPNKGNNFYRIKAIDKDGKAIYSGILSVNISGGNTFIVIYPNPVKNKQMNLQLNNVPAGKYQVVVYNTIGQQVLTKYMQHNGGSAIQNIQLPGSTKAGVYIVKVIGETSSFNIKIVIE